MSENDQSTIGYDSPDDLKKQKTQPKCKYDIDSSERIDVRNTKQSLYSTQRTDNRDLQLNQSILQKTNGKKVNC